VHNDHSKASEIASSTDAEKTKQKVGKSPLNAKAKSPLNAKAKEKKLLSSIRSFVIVMALSVHSIFEGMAIGKNLTFFLL
jgi:zinc transporter ZupT